MPSFSQAISHNTGHISSRSHHNVLCRNHPPVLTTGPRMRRRPLPYTSALTSKSMGMGVRGIYVYSCVFRSATQKQWKAQCSTELSYALLLWSEKLLAGKPPFIFLRAYSQKASEESPCMAGTSEIRLFILVDECRGKDLLSLLTLESFSENLWHSRQIHSIKPFLITAGQTFSS